MLLCWQGTPGEGFSSVLLEQVMLVLLVSKWSLTCGASATGKCLRELRQALACGRCHKLPPQNTPR